MVTAALAEPEPEIDVEVRRPFVAPLLLGVVLLLAAVAASLMIGAVSVNSPLEAWRAVTGSASPEAVGEIRDLRLPRTLASIQIGAALAVAGALIQGVTRNPIVEPSIIGINGGAAFAVALATFAFGVREFSIGGLDTMPFVAFVGAAAAAGLVFVIAAGGDSNPSRIALAGVTVALLANALVMGVVVMKENATQYLLRFLVGGVDGITWPSAMTLVPYVLIGLLVALLLARSITVLAMGDDVARGLGIRVGRLRLEAIAVVVVLAGSATAIVGPIAMVGLVVPHVVRWLVGHDYRRVVLVSIVYGAVLLVAADVVSRLIVRGVETPVGVLTAVLGTPYFIYLARKSAGVV